MIDEYKALGCKKGTFKVELELPLEFKRDFTEKGMCGNPNKMAECFDRILSAIRCKDVSSIWDYEREIIEVMKVAMGNAVMSSSEKANKWIPISKEVPKEKGEYITSTIYNEVYCDYWKGDRFDRSEAVKAWCRLPEPYKAESGGEE